MQITRWVLALALAAAATPAAARAQSILPPPQENRLFMEPYAGAFFDNGAKSGLRFDRAGALYGVRFGALAGDRVRILGDLGYARVSGVAHSPLAVAGSRIDAQNFLATGGLELEVVPGATSGTLSLQGGALWRSLDERNGASVNGTGYRAQGVLAPGAGIRAMLTSRAELKFGVHDYISFDSPARHSPALSLCVAFR